MADQKKMLCPECGDLILLRAVACACGWRRQKTSGKSTNPVYDHTCQWNDHGERCGDYGTGSPTTGGGDWYCAKHFAALRNLPWPPTQGKHESYRARWYRELKLDYVAPKLGNTDTFLCVGQALPAMKKRDAA